MATLRKSRNKKDHRPRVGRERSARTETRILEAALGVFAAMGPDAPKIDDIVTAAGISRGTFYNHFESVEELLVATSEWTTRELIETIEGVLAGLEDPALRLGVGIRLFLAKAQKDPVWSGFVARVWRVKGLELPARDLAEGLRLGVFKAPSAHAAWDVFFGTLRQALLRICNERTPAGYGDEVAALVLQALGTAPRRIAAVMKHALPALSSHEVKP